MSEPEKEIQCPFNKSHMILVSKFQRHIIKCGKDKLKDMEVCSFNATHIFPKNEIKAHEKKCEDRINVYREIYQVAGPSGKDEEDEVDKMPLVEFSDEENWNDEVQETSYNPRRAMANKPYIKEVKHHTKSIRKQIREEHRRQHLANQSSP